MIENKINDIEEELSKSKKSYDRKGLISLLGTVFFASCGITLLFGLPICGLSMLGISAGLLSTNRNIKTRKQQAERRLNQEISHLKKVESNGLNASKEMELKRKNKLNQLIVALKNSNKRLKAAKTKNNLAILGLGLSAIFTPIVPVIGLAGSAIFAVTKAYTGNKLNNQNEKVETLLNRIHNIGNDIDIIIDKSKNIQSKQKKTQQTSRRVNQQAVKSKGGTQRPTFNRNESIVKQYIDQMASLKTDSRSSTEKPVQKTK